MTTVAVNKEGIAADNIRLYLSYNADTAYMKAKQELHKDYTP